MPSIDTIITNHSCTFQSEAKTLSMPLFPPKDIFWKSSWTSTDISKIQQFTLFLNKTAYHELHTVDFTIYCSIVAKPGSTKCTCKKSLHCISTFQLTGHSGFSSFTACVNIKSNTASIFAIFIAALSTIDIFLKHIHIKCIHTKPVLKYCASNGFIWVWTAPSIQKLLIAEKVKFTL